MKLIEIAVPIIALILLTFDANIQKHIQYKTNINSCADTQERLFLECVNKKSMSPEDCKRIRWVKDLILFVAFMIIVPVVFISIIY